VAQVRAFGCGFEQLDARAFTAAAQHAEALGFGTVWIPEDYFFRGAFSLAGAVACSTQAIRVGLGVVNPFTRHPAVTAMEFAALAELAEGRALLGLGASVQHWIETQMGIPYERPRAALRETIDLIRRFFRGEAVTHDGDAFRLREAQFAFPSPRPEVPIHLGVIGPRNLEMAGALGDGALLSAMTSPAYARFAVDRIRAGAERAGRRIEDLEVGAFLLISISEDETRARDAVKPLLATLLGLLAATPDSPLLTEPGISPERIAPFGEAFAEGKLVVDRVDDALIGTFAIAGSPARCREGLAAVVEAGIQYPVAFEIAGLSPDELLESVHRNLLPHVL